MSTEGLFCPHCKRYIQEKTLWECPYCMKVNTPSAAAKIFLNNPKGPSLYNPCKKCGKNAQVILCPYCDSNIELSPRNDGMSKRIILGLADEIIKFTSTFPSNPRNPRTPMTPQEEIEALRAAGHGIAGAMDFIGSFLKGDTEGMRKAVDTFASSQQGSPNQKTEDDFDKIERDEMRKLQLEAIRTKYRHLRELQRIKGMIDFSELKKRMIEEEKTNKLYTLLRGRRWEELGPDEQHKINEEMMDFVDRLYSILDRE